jgi:nondiscriminating aspartyl-tRNA synthetase
MPGSKDARIDRNRRYSSELGPEMDGQEVTVAGWINEYRNLGGIAFIQLRDRDGIIQVTLLKKKDNELFKMAERINRESVLAIRGTLKKSDKARSGFEVIPEEVVVLAEAGVPLPMGVADKVGVELDTRLDNRFLDLRRDATAAIFKIRATMISAVRSVLEGEGFFEVHTPKIVATATEGGTNLFKMKYFSKDAFLNQSPQLFKQILMATGLDRVFEIGPAFRAEAHDTVRHLNEFTSMDIEMAFSNEEDVMEVLERVIRRVISDVKARNAKDLEALGVTLEDPSERFPRIPYKECVEIVRSKGIEDHRPPVADPESGEEQEEDLSMEALKALAKDHPGYYFITEWPTISKPFYAQPFEQDPGIVRAFDLMFGEKEITSGSQRVHDPDLLKRNIKAQGLDPDDFEFYLKAFGYGMPPHSGWGLGVERLLMIMTGRDNIRECALFPRDKKRIVP